VNPAVAGYSGTPLPRKLGIKPEARVGLISAPVDFEQTLGELPPGVTVLRRLTGTFDVIVAFFTRGDELEARLPKLRAALDQAGGLWVAWPKRSSGVETDLGDGPVRELGAGRRVGRQQGRGDRRHLVGAAVRLPARRP
jgi:hypothetical protein